MIVIWFLFLNVVVHSHKICSPLYGHEPCTFVPAPPGKTPPCARPGQTYCEQPDHYPGRLIHHLIQRWRYDHNTYFSDESKDEFSSYFFPQPRPQYGPPGYQSFGPSANNFSPDPIFIPKPQNPIRLEDHGYLPINSHLNFTGGYYNGQPDYSNQVYQNQAKNGQYYTYKYNNNFPQLNRPDYNGYYYDQQPLPYNNQLWKRRADLKYGRLKRSLRFKRSQQILDKNFENISSNSTLSLERKRRQANSVSGDPICRTRSQFIMPRAALNNKGNWMYIVNMQDDNRYTQMVRSETCVSQMCSSLCSLPEGYTSRCEQKYIQKRLVALEGGGNQLYTDVFWFPSCCVCTLSNN